MTTLNFSQGGDMSRAIGALKAHWRLLFFQGVVMLILGVLAVAVPAAATVAVEIYVGWLFPISGVVGLVAMFSTGNLPAFLWSLVTAALSVVAGILLIGSPAEGVASLTLVLTAFFIAEGVWQIVTSIAYATCSREHGAGCCSAVSRTSRWPPSSFSVGRRPSPGWLVFSLAST
jgi:uncharacterized membrane protein HdeD (DUF308 family)